MFLLLLVDFYAQLAVWLFVYEKSKVEESRRGLCWWRVDHNVWLSVCVLQYIPGRLYFCFSLYSKWKGRTLILQKSEKKFSNLNRPQIRREYCKFVQRHTWLPSCLRCAQAAAINSTSSNVQHQYVPGGPEDTNGTPTIVPPPGMSSGPMIETTTGTLSRAPKMGTQGRRMNYGGLEGGLETGTLRGQIMPAQTSPMSSTGSTQLIYNGVGNARHLQVGNFSFYF